MNVEKFNPREFAQRLATNRPGRPAGVAPDGAVVILLHGRVWRVAGGDVTNPSVICDPKIGIRTVDWVNWTPPG